MFIHTHPYDPFLFEAATKWIVGTLPPPRFSQGLLKPGDVDFCYGSRDGQLWRILDRIFGLDLSFETTPHEERKRFLKARGIGICDIVARAERKKIDASDLGMHHIEMRNLLLLLIQYPNVNTLLFTGGNSKNGPEYLFRKILKPRGLKLQEVSGQVPRIHRFFLPTGQKAREITTVSLTAPSGSANRAVGSLPEYKACKARDPNYTVMDFRAEQYRQFF